MTYLLNVCKKCYNMFTKLQKHRPESLTNTALQPVLFNFFLTVACKQGYGLLFESSVTFLMLCWTQTLCWSSSCSLKARSSSSALRSISLSAISRVLQPGPTPLKHKKQLHFIVLSVFGEQISFHSCLCNTDP